MKTSQCGFQTGPKQTELYKHRSWLNFGFRKNRNCTKDSKNKGADQLRSNCEADLHLCFCIYKMHVSHDAAHSSM